MMKFRPQHFHSQSAFTMVEVAISLAIIGIALLGIVGVLPLGLNTQRDNREKTVINQDASVLIEAIRNGSRGADDLTNYVYAITNYWTEYAANGAVSKTNNDGYGGYPSPGSQITKIASPPFFPITNGLRIIGLLSTPEFTDFNLNPTNNLFSGGYSNHVIAYVHSISGPAVEKPPQDNQILQQDSFGYRIFCVNAPVAMDTNVFILPANRQIYSSQLAANLHELRLTFEWPQLPNGNLGTGRQTYRAKISGQISQTNSIGQMLYFYQQQSFTSAP
jgi:prepilin-type N-terminal cleavage/methylation domain-containing protein